MPWWKQEGGALPTRGQKLVSQVFKKESLKSNHTAIINNNGCCLLSTYCQALFKALCVVLICLILTSALTPFHR